MTTEHDDKLSRMYLELPRDEPPRALDAANAAVGQGAKGGKSAARVPAHERRGAREAGRHEEADKALEEFGRRYPDYRIADAMWERVRPR